MEGNLVLTFFLGTAAEARLVFIGLVELAESGNSPVLQIAGVDIGADALLGQLVVLAATQPNLLTAAAYDYLLGELQETPERILIFGHSLGGAIAIDCASHRSAAGLVVQSSFTNLKEMARARFPGWPLHLIANNQFDSLGKVPELNLPKLFLHGASDETIPISLGERLFEHAAEPKEWYAVPRAGHNDVYRHGGLRYLWKLAGFCRRSLRAAKKRS